MAKAIAKGPEGFSDSQFEEVYSAYRSKMRSYGVWDYDDILLELLNQLRNNRSFREMLRSRYSHVLVDEF